MTKWLKPLDCDSNACLEVAECESAHCLEVAEEGAHLLLRATEMNSGSAHLLVSRAELASFVASAKAGHYDHLR